MATPVLRKPPGTPHHHWQGESDVYTVNMQDAVCKFDHDHVVDPLRVVIHADAAFATQVHTLIV